MAQFRFNWSAFARGMAQVTSIEFLVLSVSFLGFGALIRDSQLDIFQGVFLSGIVWALPGQVLLVSLLEQAIAPATIALAVSLTAVRLLPMVVSMLPEVDSPGTPRWLKYLLSCFISISVWVLSNRRLQQVEKSQRLPWLLGVGVTFWVASLVLTAAGYHLASFLTPILATCLVFLTPTFFLVSLFTAARIPMDYYALGAGLVLGPVLHIIIPEFDLLLAGIIGGTAAYYLARWRRKPGATK